CWWLLGEGKRRHVEVDHVFRHKSDDGAFRDRLVGLLHPVVPSAVPNGSLPGRRIVLDLPHAFATRGGTTDRVLAMEAAVVAQLPLLNVVAFAILLSSYHWRVRFTWLGGWLNARRSKIKSSFRSLGMKEATETATLPTRGEIRS